MRACLCSGQQPIWRRRRRRRRQCPRQWAASFLLPVAAMQEDGGSSDMEELFEDDDEQAHVEGTVRHTGCSACRLPPRLLAAWLRFCPDARRASICCPRLLQQTDDEQVGGAGSLAGGRGLVGGAAQAVDLCSSDKTCSRRGGASVQLTGSCAWGCRRTRRLRRCCSSQGTHTRQRSSRCGRQPGSPPPAAAGRLPSTATPACSLVGSRGASCRRRRPVPLSQRRLVPRPSAPLPRCHNPAPATVWLPPRASGTRDPRPEDRGPF